MPITVTLPTLHADQVRAYRAYRRHPRFVLRCGRRWGKTAFLTTLASDCALRGGKVGWFVPEARYSREPFLAVKAVLGPLINTSSKVEGEIRLAHGAGQVAFWSLKDNELAARGRDYDLVLFDEHAFNKPSVKDTWEKAVGPTLYDRDGRAVFASNTRGIDEDNHFFQLHGKVEAGEPNWGEFHAPTAANPLLPSRRPDETEVEHAGRRAAAIADLRRENAPLVFAQEYEAEFVSWAGQSFFALDSFLVEGQPVGYPAGCGAVFAVCDTAAKTGRENDGTAVAYYALTPPNQGPHRMVLLDWEITQIEGSLLEAWLPTVLRRCADLAAECRARGGSAGAWVEDKSTGIVLLQQARRRGLDVQPIDSKLTALGKVERAINASGSVHRGDVKISRHAYEKTTTYKGATRNHFLTQVTGFRVDDKDPHRADDLLDCLTYAVAIGLGNSEGF